jgi:diaminohydroxyphosphoribosylaminopyrimidine deaminase / 5-amino-6-(5-phosphoribosylamino)uracil reductase
MLEPSLPSTSNPHESEMNPQRQDVSRMRLALRLARRGYGLTSPNPMVGAVLVKGGKIIGQGWHRGAGKPHAEVEAIQNARANHQSLRGATLYVTLEPCCTHGRTPPCTEAILEGGIKRVVAAATDPNPAHRGKGFESLSQAGVQVVTGLLETEAAALNEAFNHWIVHRTPLVTLKAAMSLDGKIGTIRGESKWITGPAARRFGMRLRRGSDAILAGINTIVRDDPALTIRPARKKGLWRIVLDPRARLPLSSRMLTDESAAWTMVVVTEAAPAKRIKALAKRATIWTAPILNGSMDLNWLLRKLGANEITSLLVEGGGETHATFLEQRLAQRIAFFYAPKIIGGRSAPKGIGGRGVASLEEAHRMQEVRWRRLGEDWLLWARIARAS